MTREGRLCGRQDLRQSSKEGGIVISLRGSSTVSRASRRHGGSRDHVQEDMESGDRLHAVYYYV